MKSGGGGSKGAVRIGRGMRVVARLVGLALPLSILPGPAGAAQPNPSEEDARRPTTAGGRIVFEDRQPGSGIHFVLDNGTTPDKPIIDSMLGGVAVIDYDGDGRLDVFFCNGARIPSLVKDDARFWNRLYHQEKDGTFRDVTETAGVRGEGYSMGVAAADYDNDGRADLYVTGVNRNILYHNEGNGTFADVTERAGVSAVGAGESKPWSVGAAWLDYDNDGDLDLFVANYLAWSPESNHLCGMDGKRLSCSPTVYPGLPNLLYRNDGNGRFTDVSDVSGIGAHVGKGMSVTVADADGDGFLDVFVANDEMRHFLFHNEAGRTFLESGVETGVAYTEDGVPVSGMGNDFRDLDDDGRPDIVVTDLSGESFLLYRNTGAGHFVPDIYRAGLGFATVLMGGWAVGGYDLDNDGDKDLFSANSHVSENVGFYGSHRYLQANAVFAAGPPGRFRDVTATAGPAMQRARAHRGCAFGDLDGDGRVDAVVSVIGEPAEVLYNVSPASGHWLELSLHGTKSSRDAIGATVKITGESGRVQYNHVTTTVGYASSSDKRVHFGLGADATAREIEIRWPSRTVQVLRDVPADQVLEVTER
jgi:enediyne biosynthesis protein E4